MTATIDLHPYKGKQYAVYIDGTIIAIGRLARVLPIVKVLRGKQKE